MSHFGPQSNLSPNPHPNPHSNPHPNPHQPKLPPTSTTMPCPSRQHVYVVSCQASVRPGSRTPCFAMRSMSRSSGLYAKMKRGSVRVVNECSVCPDGAVQRFAWPRGSSSRQPSGFSLGLTLSSCRRRPGAMPGAPWACSGWAKSRVVGSMTTHSIDTVGGCYMYGRPWLWRRG